MTTKLILLGLIFSASAEVTKWKNAVPADDGFMRCSRPKAATSNLIKVDSGKEYDVTGTFMCSGRIGLLYLCLVPYDADRKQIQRFHVAHIPGSERTLAQAAEAGESIITVRDGGPWKAVFDRNRRKPYVAFDADHSGLFRDLPNRNVSMVKGIRELGDNGSWEVELRTPCTKDCPAGTGVRLHHGSGGLMNVRLVPEDEMPMGQAKRLDATISGERLSGVGREDRAQAFWRGTRYVQFFIMPLTGELLFKGVRITAAE